MTHSTRGSGGPAQAEIDDAAGVAHERERPDHLDRDELILLAPLEAGHRLLQLAAARLERRRRLGARRVGQRQRGEREKEGGGSVHSAGPAAQGVIALCARRSEKREHRDDRMTGSGRQSDTISRSLD